MLIAVLILLDILQVSFSENQHIFLFPETTVHEQTNIVTKDFNNVGFILKVEHPPVVGSDGSCTWHEESVVYSVQLEGIKLANANAQTMSKGTVKQGKEL